MLLVVCSSVKLPLPEAVRWLSHQFDCQSAKHIATWKKPPSSIDLRKFRGHSADHVEASARTVELPPEVREKQGLTIGAIVTGALHAFLRTLKGMAEPRQKAAHFQIHVSICLIACSSRSSRGPTIFWCPVAAPRRRAP